MKKSSGELSDVFKMNGNKNLSNSNSDIIKKLDKKKVAIYGAGNLGRQVLKLLKSNNVKVDFFLDKFVKDKNELDNTPVYRPDDINVTSKMKEDTVVLVSLFASRDIINEISSYLDTLGYTEVIFNYNLIALFLPVQSNIRKITEEVYLLLEDDHSKKVYLSNLNAHMTNDYENTKISENMTQYFDVKVPFSKGYSHFVDCGAFTGDSLIELMKHFECSTYIGFEPDESNFLELRKVVEELKYKLQNAYIFPCGVGEKCFFLHKF